MSDNIKNTPAIHTNIHKISRFGNITLMVSPEMMAEAGFEPADVILVRIGQHEMEMPIGTGYNDADSGEPVCCLLTGPEYGPGWVVLALNAGNMAAEMELAKAFGTDMKSGDGRCLAACAERYLRKAGMSSDEIQQLKRCLG